MYFIKKIRVLIHVWMLLILPAAAWAAHPLITDDAGTQGKGNFQLEINGQYDTDNETADGVSEKSTGWQLGATLSYGIIDPVDLVLTLPYEWGKVEEDGLTVYDENGISDMVFEVKWRFFEKDGLSLALKPGVSFPTGNDDKGLGAGKAGYRIFFIGTEEIAPWAFHLNVGYIGNENSIDEVKDIWHASLAATYEVIEDLKIVGNIGVEKNPYKDASNDPAFIIGGFIYSITKNFDVDFGVKFGLTSTETDSSIMAGTTFRF